MVPQPGLFRAQLTGTYDGAGGDWRKVPNFYRRYSEASHKPLTIAETSALYLPQADPGAPDLQIKQGWWSQVFAPDAPATFPNLRAILWFEQDKYESNLDARASCAITPDPLRTTAFRRALPSWLVWARQTWPTAPPGGWRSRPLTFATPKWWALV